MGSQTTALCAADRFEVTALRSLTSYGAELMSVALDENLRRAIGSATRALEERLALAKKLEKQARESGHVLLIKNWSEKAGEFERELNIIRDSVRRVDDIAAASAVAQRTAVAAE